MEFSQLTCYRFSSVVADVNGNLCVSKVHLLLLKRVFINLKMVVFHGLTGPNLGPYSKRISLIDAPQAITNPSDSTFICGGNHLELQDILQLFIEHSMEVILDGKKYIEMIMLIFMQ